MKGTKKVGEEALINGFSPISSTPVFWKSRKRPAAAAVSGIKNLVELEPKNNNSSDNDKTTETEAMGKEATINNGVIKEEENDQSNRKPIIILSEKRKALFEPLEPPTTTLNGLRSSNESLLPPPDFDLATYPKGWLVGKKRKLVNVDVVESMRRIAVQEMNRKDMEIDGLNEQLEEDARVLEHLQVQLVEERSKRGDVERQNAMLQNQITMLMDMLQYNDPVDDDDNDDEGPEEP